MKRIVMSLHDEEFSTLQQLAERDLRTPNQQLRYYLLQEIQRWHDQQERQQAQQRVREAIAQATATEEPPTAQRTARDEYEFDEGTVEAIQAAANRRRERRSRAATTAAPKEEC